MYLWCRGKTNKSNTNGMFGSLEREQKGGEQKGMIIIHFIWMFLKLVKRNGVISSFFYLDVLKIMMKMKGNDLNRQIYLYLKMNL